MARQVDFTGHRVRPASVLPAVLTNNTPVLKVLGSHGGKATARKARKKRLDEFKEWKDSMTQRINQVQTLPELRTLYSEAKKYVKPRRKKFSTYLHQQVAKLHRYFLDRSEELQKAQQQEFTFRAEEANEHLCPID